MTLTMIRYGFLAGISFLASLALLDWLTHGHTPRPGAPGPGTDAGIEEQVWRVLAEARRITEESA